jgi:hypothetical protein
MQRVQAKHRIHHGDQHHHDYFIIHGSLSPSTIEAFGSRGNRLPTNCTKNRTNAVSRKINPVHMKKGLDGEPSSPFFF